MAEFTPARFEALASTSRSVCRKAWRRDELDERGAPGGAADGESAAVRCPRL